MRVAVIIVLGVAFLGGIGAFVVLALAGKDTTAYAGFVSIAGGSLVANILNFLKTDSVSSDVGEIKQATNGPLTKMSSQIDDVHSAVISNGEVPPEKSP